MAVFQKQKIVYVVVALVLLIVFIIFFNGFGKATISKPNEMITKEQFINDIVIMREEEGLTEGFTEITANKKENIEEELIIKDGKNELINGQVIYVTLMNKLTANSKKPLEVRFFIRVLLYLNERKVSDDVGNIVGIVGVFNRNTIETFEGSQPIKMSVEEFNNLYKEADVSNLSTEKQIDILTDLWIKKTGYWRRGLNGVEERPE